MTKIHQLMESLARLTSYRDVQRLELSLLRTLDEILQPISLVFLKLDVEYQLLLALEYHASTRGIIERNSSSQSKQELHLIIKAFNHGQAAMRATSQGYRIAFPAPSLNELKQCLLVDCKQPLSATEQHLITSFFSIYHNFCNLLEDAQTDELTGLLNRKTFEENFQRISSESFTDDALKPSLSKHASIERRRYFAPKAALYWMAVIDIDHFKLVNDTFGHLYGDEVLILLARLMQDVFRREDLLYRFGGEEFVVIACCGGLEEARAVFQRFREKIERHKFPQLKQITVSIGITQMQGRVLAATLIDQADQALYYAKKNGRNQLHFYQELLSSGKVEALEINEGGSVDLF